MYSLSVVITTHDRSQLLYDCVESINRLKHRAEISVIVVSDLTDEETDKVARQVLRRGDIYVGADRASGPAESRNIGISCATAEWAMYLDDDDFLISEGIDEFIGKKDQTVESLMMFNYAAHSSPGTIIDHRRITETPKETLFLGNYIPVSCVIGRTEYLKKHRFDPTLKSHEDWDWLIRVALPTKHSRSETEIFSARQSSDSRGNKAQADKSLVRTYQEIYGRYPPPTDKIASIRNSILARLGHSLT